MLTLGGPKASRVVLLDRHTAPLLRNNENKPGTSAGASRTKGRRGLEKNNHSNLHTFVTFRPLRPLTVPVLPCLAARPTRWTNSFGAGGKA